MSLYYHFIPLKTAAKELKAGECELGIDCLRPSQWAPETLDDECVWLTTNPDPGPMAGQCPYVRLTVKLPSSKWKVERAWWSPDFAARLLADGNSVSLVRRITKASALEWRRRYRTIPSACFVDATVTCTPWWFWKPADIDDDGQKINRVA